MGGPINNNASTPVTPVARAQAPKEPDAAALSQDGLATTYTVDSRVLSSVPNLPAATGVPPAYPSAGEALRRKEILQAQQQLYIDSTLTPSAKTVVGDLTNMGVSATDIWQGSHIVLKGDRGALYSRWSSPPQDVMARTSSHESSATQYQIKTGFRETGILMGKTPQGDTWVQFERHADPHQNLAEKALEWLGLRKTAHDQDYDIYKKTRQNVGPLGLSPHTDKNPLVFSQGDN